MTELWEGFQGYLSNNTESSLDENGNLVDGNGNRIDWDGNRIDENGYLLNDRWRAIRLMQNGQYIQSNDTDTS